uniref:Uncharacterized protein n=1 Tax=Arundo donax TaxID=35708 RepID=A0A0A9HDD1_ARUDO
MKYPKMHCQLKKMQSGQESCH